MFYIYFLPKHLKNELCRKFAGKLTSESYIEEVTYLDRGNKGRNFYFTDRFIVFLKEKDKDMPYMALLVDNSEVLKKCEGK